jgi:fused-like protein
VSSELNTIGDEVVRSDFFNNLKSSYKFISKQNYMFPISIIFNLISEKNSGDDIISNITSEFFSQYQNIMFISQYNILKDISNKDLIIETLLLLSSLCRKSEKIYSCLHELNIYSDLKYLLENADSSIKSRVCNLIGNMCRHSDYFYDHIMKNGLINPLIQCCFDNEKNTRKFACFAIGNAAFLNDKLYEHLRPCIPILVGLLDDVEENTRANSAGALGNFVRCSDVLCKDINKHSASEALLKLAEREQTSNQTIKVALFALGNFCNHNEIKSQLEQINFKKRIEIIKSKFQGESSLIDLIDRIRKKI